MPSPPTPPSHHPVHFADEETEARKLDEVPRRVFPRRATCPFPWKGDSASPASAIPEPARAMHRPPHAAPAVAAMLAATGDGGTRDLARTSTSRVSHASSRGPRFGPLRVSRLPAPPRLSYRARGLHSALYTLAATLEKEMTSLAQPLISTSWPEVPPTRGREPIGSSAPSSIRSASSLAPDPPNSRSPASVCGKTTIPKTGGD